MTIKPTLIGFCVCLATASSICSTVLLSPATATESATTDKERGCKLVESCQFKESIGFLDAAIKANPSDAVLYQKRGFAQFVIAMMNGGSTKQKMCEKAIADLTKAIQLAPGDSVAHFQRSQCYKELGQLEKALNDINKSIELQPGVGAYGERAAIFTARKKYDQALLDCYKAIAMLEAQDKSQSLAAGSSHTQAGDILSEQGNNQKACAEYDKAIAVLTKVKADPMILALPHFGKAKVKLKQKQYQQAIANCEKATQIPQTLIMIGESYSALGQQQKALDKLNEAIAKYPQFSDAFSERAKVYDKLNKKALAAKDRQTLKQLGYSKSQ